MTRKVTVTLDVPPRSLHPNEYPSWQKRAADKHRYRKNATELAWAASLDGWEPATRATIQLDYYTRVNRGHDPDNLIAWAKTAIDCLTAGGVLTDDRDVTYLPPRHFVDKQRPRLEITVDASVEKT